MESRRTSGPRLRSRIRPSCEASASNFTGPIRSRLAELAKRYTVVFPVAGRSWSHDVETSIGAANVVLLRGIAAGRDFRSSWNFVRHRCHVADELLGAIS